MRLILFIVWRQIWDRKLLNGIALCGVVVGIITLLSVRGMLQGFNDRFIGSVLQVSPHVTVFDRELRRTRPILAELFPGFIAADVSHQGPDQRQTRIKHPEDVVRFLERDAGVAAASGSLVGSTVLALGTREYPVEVRGIDPLRQERVTPLTAYVTAGRYAEFLNSGAGVLLGIGVARQLGARAGDVVVCNSGRGTPLQLKVVGIFDSNIPQLDGSRIYISLRNAQVLLGRPDTVSRLEVRLRNPELAPELARRLEAALGYDAESWQEANANFFGLIRSNQQFSSFIIGMVLAVGGFGILAIQTMLVLQKSRDIAILRSVGFRRRDVLLIFLMQGAWLGVTGALIGGVLGHWVLVLMSQVKLPVEAIVRANHLIISDDPIMYVYGLVFALTAGLLASFLPALRGSKVEPVDVLRGHVG